MRLGGGFADVVPEGGGGDAGGEDGKGDSVAGIAAPLSSPLLFHRESCVAPTTMMTAIKTPPAIQYRLRLELARGTGS